MKKLIALAAAAAVGALGQEDERPSKLCAYTGSYTLPPSSTAVIRTSPE